MLTRDDGFPVRNGMPRTSLRICILHWMLGTLCCGVGFATTWQSRRIAYHPLDQSIVFDGAWRVMNGQVPWRDFVLPSGLTPILMQATLFKVAGVSWNAYVLHAAVINGVASGVVYLFLCRLSLPRAASAMCGLLTAVTLYPPAGTPYLEIHSMFFCLLATVLAHRIRKTPVSVAAWIGTSVCLALAALSKQVPAAFFLPMPLLAAAMSVVPGWRSATRLLMALTLTG